MLSYVLLERPRHSYILVEIKNSNNFITFIEDGPYNVSFMSELFHVRLFQKEQGKTTVNGEQVMRFTLNKPSQMMQHCNKKRSYEKHMP